MYDPYFPILSFCQSFGFIVAQAVDIIFIVQIPFEFACFAIHLVKTIQGPHPKSVLAVFKDLVNVGG